MPALASTGSHDPPLNCHIASQQNGRMSPNYLVAGKRERETQRERERERERE